MEFLKKIFRGRATIQQLPAGTITVDRDGNIVASTVSSSYPKNLLREIGHEVITIFHEARNEQTPLAEVSLHFGSLRLTARELRGGAIVFLFPQTALLPSPNRSSL
jgi:hypothetical protein